MNLRTPLILLGIAAVALALAPVASAQGVVINEVSTAATMWFEVANLGPNPVDISGWRLQSAWDNPADGILDVDFLFPGNPAMPFAVGNTTLNPDQVLIVSEVAGTPAVPGGTLFFTGINSPYFTGVPYSAALIDNNLMGVDYIAASNINAFDTPMSGAVWTGGGFPNLGGIPSGTLNDISYRHTRVDSDDAMGWTNDGAIGTAGRLNPGQVDPGVAMILNPIASFEASITCGAAPLTVLFTNTSFAETEFTTVTWDFDAINNPGTSTSTTHHASNAFTATSDVSLTVVDFFGSMDSTLINGAGAGSTMGGNEMLVLDGGATLNIQIAGTPPSPITGCISETFDNFPALVPDPCGGVNAVPDPTTGFEYRGRDIGSRLRIVGRNTIAVAWNFTTLVPAPLGNGVVILDTTNNLATNEFALHIDGTAFGAVDPMTGLYVNANAGFTVRYFLLENNDEQHTYDAVLFQDGNLIGGEVNFAGAPTGLAGFDGFQEVLINDWQLGLGGIQRVWVQFTHTIDNAFLIANGLTVGSDMRVIWRQQDNVTFEGNDGLAIGQIEVIPGNAAPGNGQAPDAMLASFDMNNSLTALCQNVDSGAPGPYFANGTGGSINMEITGQPNRPILLLGGPVNPGVLPISPAQGQIDLGVANPNPPFIPNNIVILANGNQPDFLNALFNTGPTGTVNFTIPNNLPPATVAGFQCLVFNGTASVIKMTNAVQFTSN